MTAKKLHASHLISSQMSFAFSMAMFRRVKNVSKRREFRVICLDLKRFDTLDAAHRI